MNHSSSRLPNKGAKAPPDRTLDHRNTSFERNKQSASLDETEIDTELDKLNQIIDTALSLEAPQREPFIQRSCGENAALYDRILALISRCTCPPPSDFLQPPLVTRHMIHKVYRRCFEEGGE